MTTLWTEASVDEALVLGVVEALLPGHSPAIANPLNVVPNSGFEPRDPALPARGDAAAAGLLRQASGGALRGLPPLVRAGSGRGFAWSARL